MIQNQNCERKTWEEKAEGDIRERRDIYFYFYDLNSETQPDIMCRVLKISLINTYSNPASLRRDLLFNTVLLNYNSEKAVK